jgi:anti-sigma B factor antagonist
MNAMDQPREIVTVMLPERVDSETALEAEKTMLEALRPGARMIVDGSDVTYMSAAGVRTLATVLRQAEERQARVVFCRFSGPAEDCLVVGGFAQLLDVVATRDEAAARLRPKLTGEPEDRLHARGAAG